MLAFQHNPHTPQYQYQPHAFAPSTPSPLSPRRQAQNAFGQFRQSTSHVPRYFSSMNAADQQQQQQQRQSQSQSQPQQQPSTHTPERIYRPELHRPTQDALSQKRRAIFHRKIASQREDKNWARRGEELERLDDRNEWVRWERETLRFAPEHFDGDELDEGDGDEVLFEEADEVARMEEREIEALVEMMDVERGKGGMGVEGQVDFDEHFGSDEEDYESLFAGLECDASQQAGLCQGEQRQETIVEQEPRQEQEAEGMDLS